MKRAMLAGSLIAALVLAIALGWISLERTHDLERRLETAKGQVQTLRGTTEAYARELESAVKQASEARESAQSAAQRAAEAGEARVAAEGTSRLAEEAKTRAEEAKTRAESDARQSREQLADLRERREAELNRMQEALARIAATRRTDSGLVVDLTSDSFHFDFDQATLRPENREMLSRIAGVLLVSNGYRLFVHGYTDDVGTEEYNRQLSERRAQSVASYLVSAGISPDIVETKGFGKLSPRAAGTTSEARRKNRRVEIVVVDSIIHYAGEKDDGRK